MLFRVDETALSEKYSSTLEAFTSTCDYSSKTTWICSDGRGRKKGLEWKGGRNKGSEMEKRQG